MSLAFAVGDEIERRLSEGVPVHAAPVFDPLAAVEALHVPTPEPLAVDPGVSRNTEAVLVLDANGNVTGLKTASGNTLDFSLFGSVGEGKAFVVNSGNPKDAIGDTKPDTSLVPSAGILLEAQAFMDGAKKYGPYNWRDNAVRMRVYLAAAQRHISQLLDGEDIDPISGVYHIGHARACLGILADAQFTGNLIDDRPTKGAAGDMIRRFGEAKSFKPE